MFGVARGSVQRIPERQDTETRPREQSNQWTCDSTTEQEDQQRRDYIFGQQTHMDSHVCLTEDRQYGGVSKVYPSVRGNQA